MSYGDAEFVLAFFAIVVGIPVVCSTLVKLIHGPRDKRRARRHKMDQDERQRNDRDSELLEDIFNGLKDLGKRVNNLETILDDQGE